MLRHPFFILTVSIFIFASCTKKEKSKLEKIVVDLKKVDSIITHSDTGFERIIGAKEFYRAGQYFNKKDSIITKILRDSSGNITGMVQFRKNKRIDFAEYYSNGQLKAQLPLDEGGQFHGPSKFFYEDGRIKTEGNYLHGLYTGEWKNYTSEGLPESVDSYDENGQHIGNKKLNNE